MMLIVAEALSRHLKVFHNTLIAINPGNCSFLSIIQYIQTLAKKTYMPGICHVKWTFNLVFIDLLNLRDKSQADSVRGERRAFE
jgi:hypothetical protein